MKAPFLALLAFTFASSLFAETKPNIVFILADDLGQMDIGAFNPKTFYETPNIDGLAKRGMKFTQGYAACCVCSPTRGSLMTGKYPPRFGITNFIPGGRSGKLLPAPNAGQLPLAEVTIAESLRDAGYETFFAGKWHLGGAGFMPRDQGFTHDESEGTGPKGGKGKKQDDPKNTDSITDAAVKFIEANKDKPFYAYLPYNAPHVPIGARADLVAKWQEKAKQAPADVWGQERANQVRLVQNNPVYAAMLEQFDTAIGRVLSTLEKNGLTEKTIIVFMSDNGGLATAEGHPTSNLPLRAGKGWPYEGGVREPMIVVAPGVTKPDTTCDSPVISTDFYPTLLQLVGQPLKPEQHLDGVSFLPLLKGESATRGKPLFWHYPHYANQGGPPCTTIRDGDWKLIEWHEDGALELYNIPQDIGEKNNLASAQPDKVKELHAKLIAWRKEVGALMPAPNPNFDPNAKQEAVAPKKAKKKKQAAP
ncbi:MAG: sulfatase [Verrucomicrobia bacterium]|nr:sulfatase [Verrucomicrobiota bacterium]